LSLAKRPEKPLVKTRPITRAILPRNQSPSVSNSQRGRKLWTVFWQLDDIFEPPGRNELIVWKTDSRFFFSRLTRTTGVWGSRASRAQDSYATLYRFLYWFWEKNRLFCSLQKKTIQQFSVTAAHRLTYQPILNMSLKLKASVPRTPAVHYHHNIAKFSYGVQTKKAKPLVWIGHQLPVNILY